MKFMTNKKMNAVIAPIVGLSMIQSPIIAVAPEVDPVIVEERFSVSKKVKEQLSASEKQADYVFFELERMNKVDIDIDNLLIPSNISIDEVEYLLEGTSLYNCSKYYVEAEEIYGVNALAIMSITALESGWGNSKLAKLKNNLSGFMAYNVETFESARSFSSKRESILETARLLKEKYLMEDGSYYSGTGFRDVNYHYCTLDDGKTPDYNWSKKLINISKGFTDKLEELHNDMAEKLIATL